jgi:hypothetical protein
LADASVRREGAGGFTIEQDRVSRGGDASSDETNEVVMQAKASKRRIKEIPVEPVKSFRQVDFKKKSMMLPGFERKGVNNFLGDNNVGRNVLVLYESRLRVVNIIG